MAWSLYLSRVRSSEVLEGKPSLLALQRRFDLTKQRGPMLGVILAGRDSHAHPAVLLRPLELRRDLGLQRGGDSSTFLKTRHLLLQALLISVRRAQRIVLYETRNIRTCLAGHRRALVCPLTVELSGARADP